MRRGKLVLLAGCTAAAWLLLRRKKVDGETGNSGSDPMAGFLQFATALEAQQVPLYRTLANACRLTGQPHLAVGLEKAMLTEQEHLDKLQSHAFQRRVPVGSWAAAGSVAGLISGKVLSLFDLGIGLKVISLIENRAVKDYRDARKRCKDQALRDMFLSNQVDEENHAAWAERMRLLAPARQKQ